MVLADILLSPLWYLPHDFTKGYKVSSAWNDSKGAPGIHWDHLGSGLGRPSTRRFAGSSQQLLYKDHTSPFSWRHPRHPKRDYSFFKKNKTKPPKKPTKKTPRKNPTTHTITHKKPQTKTTHMNIPWCIRHAGMGWYGWHWHQNYKELSTGQIKINAKPGAV